MIRSAIAWHRTGVGLIVASCVLFVAMQAVTGDWMPPDISFSQYGVGPYGWILSLYLAALGIGPLCLDRASPTGRLTTTLLLIGAAGCLLMAVVRTDPGGLQQSARAKVHMVGSVIAVSLVPLGSCLSLLRSRRIARWVPLSITGFAALCLVLLLISATGVDTLGVGAAVSWAYWQTGSAAAEVALLVVFAWRSVPRDERPGENHHSRAGDAAAGRPPE